MDGLEPLGSDPVQIDPEFLDPINDRELINRINNLDPLDEFDDLEEWSDDIDLIMESFVQPNRINELWHISKAKKMQNHCATVQTENAPVREKPWARAGLPPPEPTYCPPKIPFGTRNTASIFKKATTSKNPNKSGNILGFPDGYKPISWNLGTSNQSGETQQGRKP